jgi:pilus assembly protein CpaB
MRLRQTHTDTVAASADAGAYAGVGSRSSRKSRRQLNPRQRQGILLMVVAAAGLIAVFVLLSSYVNSVSRQVGPMVSELELSQPVKAYQPITSADLRVHQEPAKWAGPNVLTQQSSSESAALGLISSTPLDAGTVLQKGMLTEAPQVPPGDDEFALYLGAESAVAGQVQTDDNVDIVGTFGGSNNSAGTSRVVVSDAKVLSVGSVASGTSNASIPVLLALTPHQMLLVEGAKTWASDLSLALLGPNGSRVTPAPVNEGTL